MNTNTSSSSGVKATLPLAAKILVPANLHLLSKYTSQSEGATVLGRISDHLKEVAIQLRTSAAQAEDRKLLRSTIKLLAYPSLPIQNIVLDVLTIKPAIAIDELQRILSDTATTFKDAALLALGAVERTRALNERGSSCKFISSRLQQGDYTPAVVFRSLRYLELTESAEVLFQALRGASTEQKKILFEEIALLKQPRQRERLLDQLVKAADWESTHALNPRIIPSILSSAWIVKHLTVPVVQRLALRFGYIDDFCFEALQQNEPNGTAEIRTLLNQFSLANQTLLIKYHTSKDQPQLIADWDKRGLRLAEALQNNRVMEDPQSITLQINSNTLCPEDAALLFSTLRTLDLANLETKRLAKPFDIKHQEFFDGRFYGMSWREFNTEVLPDFYTIAEDIVAELPCPAEKATRFLPYILCDIARAHSETDRERSAELLLECHAAWSTINTLTALQASELVITAETCDSLSAQPINAKTTRLVATESTENTIRLLHHNSARAFWPTAILGVDTFSKHHRTLRELIKANPNFVQLSRGAQSALEAMALSTLRTTDSNKSAQDWSQTLSSLDSDEKILSERSPSIGIEVQNTSLPYQKTFAWKELLRLLKIPSPLRPEFFSMVEAAIAPAWTPQAMQVSLQNLDQLGFFGSSSDAFALHISLGADLGAAAQQIAAGFWPLNPTHAAVDTDLGRWFQTCSKIFSKGLVYSNSDKSTIAPRQNDKKPLCRSELRIFLLQNPALDREKFNAQTQFLFPAVQTLATAAMAHDTTALRGLQREERTQLQTLWANYCSKLEQSYQQAGTATYNFFKADWSEGTGDVRDTRIIQLLETPRLFHACLCEMDSDKQSWELLQSNVRGLIGETVQQGRAILFKNA